MIPLLLAATLHLTLPEQFFCDDLYGETLRECVHRTRRWICSPEDVGDEIDTDRLYAATVREERRLVCRERRYHSRLRGRHD